MNDNLLDEAVEFLDKSFENASVGQISRAPEPRQADEAVVQDLFAQIAVNYARPIKRFISELSQGTATKEWIDICRPILQSIMGAAKSMNLDQAVRGMAAFDTILGQGEKSPQGLLEGELRWQALTSYEELKDVFPDVFQIDKEDQRREDMIIRLIFKQIPRVGRPTLAKLCRAGLGSLSSLLMAKPDDLAATTSIPLSLCERICEKLQQYRAVMESLPRDATQSSYRSCLTKLVRELRHQEEEIERTLAGVGSKLVLETERHQRRQLRQRCNLQITVMLAELGELDLIQKIQKLSFKRRIGKLEKYLEMVVAIENGAHP